MTDPTATWRTGSDHGLVWNWGLALVSDELELDQVTDLWRTLSAGSDLGLFLQTLGTATGRNVLNLPDFAVAVFAPDVAHVAVRGRFVIVLDVAGDPITIEGGEVTTWVERRVEQVATVELWGGDHAGVPGSGTVRPIQAGVVPCSGLTMGAAPRPSAPECAARPPQNIGSGAGAITTEIRVPVVAPAAPPTPDAPPTPEVPQVSDPVDIDPQRPGDSETLTDVELDEHPPAGPDEPASPPAESEPEPEAGADGAGVDDASLGVWQQDYTFSSGVEDAAVRTDDESTPPAAPSTEFISSVPKATPSASTAPSPGGGAPSGQVDGPREANDYVADLEEHDNHTIAGLEDLVPPVSTGHPADDDTELVTAAMCEDGHPNPAHRTSCRICGGVVGATLHTLVPRPSLGTVLSPTGETFELTGPIIIGRKPRVDRVQGPHIPRLLPLPHGHVSANHLQLRIEGWTVLAVDLHSRNGTFLRRLGQPAARLPETPTPLAAGDVLDLGHGVQLTFKDLP